MFLFIAIVGVNLVVNSQQQKCTQDPSRASLQFIWTLSYALLWVGGRIFDTIYEIFIVLLWESCNYSLFHIFTSPSKNISAKNIFNFSFGKWAAAMQTSQLLQAISGVLAFQMINVLLIIPFCWIHLWEISIFETEAI